jgi:fibronectin-binding autotransporter adhesin
MAQTGLAGGVTTWNGGAGTSWSAPSNWSTLPDTSGTWGLVFGGVTGTNSTNNIGIVTVDSLSFTNSQNPVFTLSGSALALSNATITTTATTGVIAALGDTIGNALSLNGVNTFTIGAGHNLGVSGVISGTGSMQVSGANNIGWLYLSGTNTYSGGTTITSGLIQNGLRASLTDYNSFAFGTGDIVASGSGTVQIRNQSIIANNFTIGGLGTESGTFRLGALRGSFGTGTATATVSGSISLSSDASITTGASANVTGSKLLLSGPVDIGLNTLTLAAALASGGTSSNVSVPIEVSGRILGSGSVVIANHALASVLLSGSNSYSGGTVVDGGTLLVGDAHAVGTGPLTVNNGGILDVNGQALSVGSLQLNSGATVNMGITGTASPLYARIISESTVAFEGALALNFGSNGFANGDAWQLFSSGTAGGFSGNFSSITSSGSYGNLSFSYLENGIWSGTGGSLAAGQSFLFFVDNSHKEGDQYAAGQLVLVPEPSAFVIAGIGLGLIGAHRLRQRVRSARKQALASC